MKFGCCIQKKEDIIKTAELGFDFYEYSGSAVSKMSGEEFEQMLLLTEKAGIPCLGFNSYCSGKPAIVGEAFRKEEALDYARLICARGGRLGIGSIGIGAPAARRLPKDYPGEKADSQCREFLRITAGEAARYGQTLLFEAVHNRLCDYATRTREAVEMVESLGIGNLALVLDFYHMKMMGEPLKAAEGALLYLRHVHVSSREEGLRRGFPGAEDEDEYREIFAWLKAGGYDGTLSIEASEFEPLGAAKALELLKILEKERSC